MSETHTPGPIVVNTEYGKIDLYHGPGGKFGSLLYSDYNRELQKDLASVASIGDARLLAAAYTSYDKHCGPRAVELAEQDYLGELIYELQNMTVLARNLAGDVEFDSIKAADELLAKLPKEKTDD